MNERGFYCVITQDRLDDLRKFLLTLKAHNDYPVIVAIAKDATDAYRKKTEISYLSPFDTTIYIDTDTLIMGNLNYMFELGERGYFAIYREKRVPTYNAGVFVLPKEVKKWLTNKWLPKYDDKMKRGIRTYYQWKDQDILNELIKEMPLFVLPREYNCILQDITPEEEAEIYDNVKIFHFLHNKEVDKNKYKSWNTWLKL